MQATSTKPKKKNEVSKKPKKEFPEYNANDSSEDKFSEKLSEVSVDSVEGSQTESPVPSNRPARKSAGII